MTHRPLTRRVLAIAVVASTLLTVRPTSADTSDDTLVALEATRNGGGDPTRRCELVSRMVAAFPDRFADAAAASRYVRRRAALFDLERRCRGETETLRSAERLLEVTARSLGGEDRAEDEYFVALALRNTGALTAARRIAERARPFTEGLASTGDFLARTKQHQLGMLIAALDLAEGRMAEAEDIVRRLHAIELDSLSTHPTGYLFLQILAESASTLAALLDERGAANEAETILRATLERCSTVLGARHASADVSVASLRLALARALRASGDPAGAREETARATFALEASWYVTHAAAAPRQAYESMASQLVRDGYVDAGESTALDVLVHMMDWTQCAPGPLGILSRAADRRGDAARAMAWARLALLHEERCGSHLGRAERALDVAEIESRIASRRRARSLIEAVRQSYADGSAMPLPITLRLKQLEGRLAAEEGDTATALRRFREALVTYEQMVGATSTTSTLERTEEYVRVGQDVARDVLRWALERPDDPSVGELAVAALLSVHGRGLDVSAAIHGSATPTLEPGAAARLREARNRLSSLALNPPDGMTEAARRASMQELRDRIRGLEEHTSSVGAPTLETWMEEGLLARMGSRLGPEDVLVHFARVPTAVRSDEATYVAVVVRPPGTVRVIGLGDAAGIEARVEAWLRAMGEAPREAHAAAPTVPSPFEESSERALLEAMGGATRRRIVPDGALERIPFDALRDGDRFWVDSASTVLSSSLRELARPSSGHGNGDVVVIADPDFGSSADGASIPPLPGTREEARAIARLVPTARTLVGNVATEEGFLALRGPGVLHVATHGVFGARHDAREQEATASRSVDRALVGARFRDIDEPFIRSALLFSDAARPATTGRTTDGIVTAMDILGMDLRSTELVVLSACDSGRGDVVAGSGSYGLKRALLFAGAESVVTSLWKVSDEVTAGFMADFYGALREGVPREEALRQAELSIRRAYPHPYFWAAFVLTGGSGSLGLARSNAVNRPSN